MSKLRILPKRLPEPQSMDTPEREYLRNLMRYQRAFAELMKEELHNALPEIQRTALAETPFQFKADSVDHFDSNIERSISKLFESVQKRLTKLFPDALLRKWSENMVTHVNSVSKKNVTKLGEAVDLDIEPLMKDKELTPYFKNVVDENVGLIKSISQAKIPTFKNALVNMITNDVHNKDFWPDITKYIDQNTMSVKAHAKLIARDQIGKLNGRLNQYRQQKLGGTRYYWRTSKDERVRKSHKDISGKIFSWTKKGEVDSDGNEKPGGKKKPGKNHDLNPGQDFQCRCTAEMIIGDVID